MDIQGRLEDLRAKPEHVRRKVAFWSAFGITAVIFAFWIGSFSLAATGSQGAVASAVSSAPSPGQSLIAGVGGFADDIWSMIAGPKKVTYSSVEIEPGK